MSKCQCLTVTGKKCIRKPMKEGNDKYPHPNPLYCWQHQDCQSVKSNEKTVKQKTEKNIDDNKERAEKQRVEKQKAEKQKAERQKAERQKAEKQKAERQQAERQQAEKQKAERQKAGTVSKKAAKAQAKQSLVNIMETKRRVGPKTVASKRKMLKDCGTKCCADVTDDMLCHYAMCAEGTCDPTCDVIYGTSVLAQMNSNRAAGFAKNPRSKEQMEAIQDKVLKTFNDYHCSLRKKKQ